MSAYFILIPFYLLMPLLIIFLCHRFPVLNRAGSVVIAYVLGLILGNSGLLGAAYLPLQDLLMTLSIPIALPLLLFSLKINKWVHLAPKTVLSMVLALSGLVVMVTAGHALWQHHIGESWKVAGLLVGVYSGGTPNLASIKTALSVDETTFVLTHTYDIVLCALYLFILITFGKVFLRRILPSFRHKAVIAGEEPEKISVDDYNGFFRKRTLRPLLAALGIALLIFAIGGGLSMIVPKSLSMVTAILSITTLGIIASMIPRINKIEKTFELGMYFILIFSLVVASMADISSLKISSLYIFYYVALAVFGTLILHIILSKIFRIDADTMMITSVAMVFSPPFVPMMAGVLKNRQIVLSGLAVGIIGYALGNYLGVAIAFMLR